MKEKPQKKPSSRWRELLATLISMILIAQIALTWRQVEVQWSKDQTAVIIKR